MMAALMHEASAAPSPNAQAQCFDIDQYLNLDNTAVPTPSTSPANTSKAFPTPSPAPTGSTALARQALPSQQSFSAPSHQYEQYKQQTGLPTGALANTFALNDPERYQFPSAYPIDSPTNGFFGMNTVDPESDFMDFNSVPEQTPSGDLDMDYGSMQMNSSSFINPAAVTAAGTQSYSQTTLPGRVWPGMHQQQAAMAKAQQQAQQQAVMATQRERSASIQSRHPSVVNERESEDMVEESISRLLNRMRNSSVTSSTNEDSQGTTGSGPSSRMRKDEEDMDEDERLLASEEGKKLSSKERRQLRNKVSARAFRSRRKEYIGQLEGELATKTTEADELRAKNAELMAENTRLTDLTRLLLSSTAFSQFLNDLSGTSSHTSTIQSLAPSGPQSQAQQQQQQPQQQQQQMPQKDANPNQYSMSRSHSSQNGMHLNMAIIPEEPSLESGAPTARRYASNSTGIYGSYDAQVFALPYVSEAPTLDSPDFTLLNDKTSSSSGFHSQHESVSNSKDAPAPIEPLPLLPTLPQITSALASTDLVEESTEAEYVPLDLDDSDPIFALYADEENTTSPSSTAVDKPVLSGEAVSNKVHPSFTLALAPQSKYTTTTSESVSTVPSPETVHRFERLCEDADAIVTRLNRVTARPGRDA